MTSEDSSRPLTRKQRLGTRVPAAVARGRAGASLSQSPGSWCPAPGWDCGCCGFPSPQSHGLSACYGASCCPRAGQECRSNSLLEALFQKLHHHGEGWASPWARGRTGRRGSGGRPRAKWGWGPQGTDVPSVTPLSDHLPLVCVLSLSCVGVTYRRLDHLAKNEGRVVEKCQKPACIIATLMKRPSEPTACGLCPDSASSREPHGAVGGCPELSQRPCHGCGWHSCGCTCYASLQLHLTPWQRLHYIVTLYHLL